jgi:hypothetical protein
MRKQANGLSIIVEESMEKNKRKITFFGKNSVLPFSRDSGARVKR